jgi:hypothetical protein
MNSYQISFRDDDIILAINADGYSFDSGYFNFYVGDNNIVFRANVESVRYVKKFGSETYEV